MEQWYTSNQWWGLYIAAFVVVALGETFRPARAPGVPVWRRWGTHSVLALLGNLLMMGFRVSSVVLAGSVRSNGWGGVLHHSWIPGVAQFGVAFLALDMVRYFQHRAYHAVLALWKLHQVHHSDEDVDLTTGLRFHPFETVLSQGSYLAVVVLLAPPAMAVAAVELVTMCVDLFSHANFSVARVKWLGRLVVTPDVHGVHHAVGIDEQNTNFGTIFPWWDRMFGTYREPRGDERLGMVEVPGGSGLGVWGLLVLPVRTPTPALQYLPPEPHS